VVTATSKKVGGYYEIDNVLVTNQHSEWDLLNYLAAKEKFVVYVRGQGTALRAAARPGHGNPLRAAVAGADADQPVAALNAMHLRFTARPDRRQGHRGVGAGQEHQDRQGPSGRLPDQQGQGHKARPVEPGCAQVYTFRLRDKPMTPEAALQDAQAKHREITQHEVKLRALMPADNVLSCQHHPGARHRHGVRPDLLPGRDHAAHEHDRRLRWT
jgi:hypothetical protein